MLRFLSLILITLCNGNLAFAAADFEDLDADVKRQELNDPDGSDLSAMPEIEPEQQELRQQRGRAVGISFGEVVPNVSLMLEYQGHLDEQTSFFVSFGRGSMRSVTQESNEEPDINKLSTTAGEMGYVWWLSKSFPFAASAAINFIRGSGQIMRGDNSKGQYRLDSLGSTVGLQVETVFENGVWIKWVLLSAHYSRILAESHANVSASKLKGSRARFSGFKALGITNFCFGFSW